jgi:hypothetical protein
MANEFKHKDPGAELTQCEYVASDGTGHIFAGQATGDILYASSATVLKNLGRGGENEILSMGGSLIPAWTASPSVTDLTIGGGCITLSAATDIDLLDNNASALSFDSTGKTGIIEIVTTNCSEGVTMSGTLTVGVCDTGADVKFFGASAGAFMLYDQSCNLLEVRGATAAGPGHLKLTTGEATVVANDVLGKIEFQAPAECGTDAVKVSATIAAVAQGTFAANVNATDLIFYTGHDNCVAERFRFTSQNEIGIAGANYGSNGQVLTSGGAGAAVAWEDAAGGPTNVNCVTKMVDQTNEDTYVPPDLVIHNPGVAKAWAMFQGNISTPVPTPACYHNVASIIDNGTGSYSLCYDVNMGSTTYVVLAHSNYNHSSQQSGLNVAHTGEVGFANNCHSAVDTTNTFIAVFGLH